MFCIGIGVVKMSTEKLLYRDPATMEPLYPEHANELEVLAIVLIEKASGLAASLHPETAKAIAGFLRPMNSYYSNLIEGHDTHPIDIAKALKEDFSHDKKNRSLQLEAIAHIKLSKDIFEKPINKDFNPYAIDFLKWVHHAFYNELPVDFRVVKDVDGNDTDVVPGETRKCQVKVGRHLAPDWAHLEAFLNRFESFYNPTALTNSSRVRRIISMAAAHHRLAWVHPFVDGNGRVVRLLSDACFLREGLNSAGLWSMARGLARHEMDYKKMLANADLERYNDYDGRGNLSLKMLVAFCVFYLKTAIDQIEYMKTMLRIDTMLKRIHTYVDLMVVKGELKTETRYIMEAVFLKGEIARREVERVTGKSDKTAKAMADSLLKLGLLTVDETNHLAPYKVSYSIAASPVLFPSLYPTGKEGDMMALLK